MDVKRHARFLEPVQAVTGKCTRGSRGWAGGSSTLSSTIAPASPTQRSTTTSAQTVTEFTRRALNWFLGSGIVGERLLTDKRLGLHQEQGLARPLGERRIEHWRTKPYSPQRMGR